MKLVDGTSKEELHLASLINAFEQVIVRDADAAKKMFRDTMVPYVSSLLRTVKILDDQVTGSAEQNALLLKSNVVLIDLLKKNGVAMPNFDQIKRDVRKELQIEG